MLKSTLRVGPALLASVVAAGCSGDNTTIVEPASTSVDPKARAKMNPKLQDDFAVVGVKKAAKKSP